MFEEVDQPVQPTPPRTEPPKKAKEEKDWGPFKPLSKSAPPQDLPTSPTPTSSPPPAPPRGIPDNLNIGSPYQEEPKPSRTKYIILGIIVIIVIAALVIGAIYVLNLISNENTNANIAENANTETNENLNITTNTNINENANLNVNQETNTNTEVKSDKDLDGIEDSHEIYLGTDPEKQDSDGDGYSDLQEIKNRYNPIGEGLFESADFKLFCSKYIQATVPEEELSPDDQIKTCDIATSIFDLTDKFKSVITDAIEKDMQAECLTLGSIEKSDSCETAFWLLALIFQQFDAS